MPFPARCAALVALVLCLAVGGSRAEDAVLSWSVPMMVITGIAPREPGRSAPKGPANPLSALDSPVLLVHEVRSMLGRAAEARRRDGESEAFGLERMAALTALVAYVGLRTNAPLCNDVTSPDEHVYQLGQMMPQVSAILARLDADVRRALVQEALRLDASLAFAGRGDPMICKTGIHGSRYCPEEPARGACESDAFPLPEFSSSSLLPETRERARRRARAEVSALAEPYSRKAGRRFTP